MHVELMAALSEASSDDSVVVVVLVGKGRYFCAGMDFNNDLGELQITESAELVRNIKGFAC